MELINGKEISGSIVEQITTLSEVIREKKKDAISAIKDAAKAMHMQGQLLVQEEMRLGSSAFQLFLDLLSTRGVDPELALWNMKQARKYATPEEMLSSPSQARQMLLQMAPSNEGEQTDTDRVTAAFTFAYHLNVDFMNFTSQLTGEYLTKGYTTAKGIISGIKTLADMGEERAKQTLRDIEQEIRS
jgi:hypothetical protein